MKKGKLELPDGRLITVEGDDKETIATFVANHYLGHSLPVKNSAAKVLVTEYTPVVEALTLPTTNQPNYQGQTPVPAAAQTIEPLPLPGPSLGSCESLGTPASGQPDPAFPRYKGIESQVLNVPAANGTVEPLRMPTMNFEKPGSKKKTPATNRKAPAVNQGVEALPLPAMNFDKIKAA